MPFTLLFLAINSTILFNNHGRPKDLGDSTHHSLNSTTFLWILLIVLTMKKSPTSINSAPHFLNCQLWCTYNIMGSLVKCPLHYVCFRWKSSSLLTIGIDWERSQNAGDKISITVYRAKKELFDMFRNPLLKLDDKFIFICLYSR